MVSSFKQLTVNMKSLLDMQLGVGIKTVEDWILNLGAEVYKAQYDLGPEYVQNSFSRSLKKTSHQRKLRQRKRLFFNFE